MPDETIRIEVLDKTYDLSKLERHLLYCCLDGKSPSQRLYTNDEINVGWYALQLYALVDAPYQMTPEGKLVAQACKDRPRS